MGVLMRNTFIFLFALLYWTQAFSTSKCASLQGEVTSFMAVNGGGICFVLQPLLDNDGKAVSTMDKQINLYYVTSQLKLKKIGEMPYSGASGEVKDAFLLDVNRDKEDELIVIHAVEHRSDVGTSMTSSFYSVFVFNQTNDAITLNERATNWYGYGADISTEDGRKILYIFPYKDRSAIQNSLSSPFIRFLVNESSVSAKIIRKTYLYNSPLAQDITKKYLVSGDKVILKGVTASWCDIQYDNGKILLEMWVNCDNLKITDDD
jgi:hypothetical protein